MNEVWKDAVGYEGYYQVSNFGRVKQCEVYTNLNGKSYTRKEKIKKQCVRNGYYVVGMTKDGIKKVWLVHRLVAFAFVNNPNTDKYDCVNHKDENKLNNRADNLEWCDRAYNDNYGTRNQKLSIKSKEYAKNHVEELRERTKKSWDCGKNKGFSGCKHSDESKQKIKKNLKAYYANGGKHPMLGVHRYGKDAPRYGAILSDETKKKIGDANRGKKHTDEFKQKVSQNIKGRIFINNGIINKRVREGELDSYIKLGFVKGRLTPWQ